ncbi:DUF3781 domain-containing protein [Lactonifactor longoviformis]|uniref:DUF3781 domain-containing protein n=1 Tax=Lactonifactor longoviformis TaxID=341220 RepID=UPI0036F3609A
MGGIKLSNELLKNLDKVHTTELGALCIKRNLSLDTDDVAGWCKLSPLTCQSPHLPAAKNGWMPCGYICGKTENLPFTGYSVLCSHLRPEEMLRSFSSGFLYRSPIPP